MLVLKLLGLRKEIRVRSITIASGSAYSVRDELLTYLLATEEYLIFQLIGSQKDSNFIVSDRIRSLTLLTLKLLISTLFLQSITCAASVTGLATYSARRTAPKPEPDG